MQLIVKDEHEKVANPGSPCTGLLKKHEKSTPLIKKAHFEEKKAHFATSLDKKYEHTCIVLFFIVFLFIYLLFNFQFFLDMTSTC